MSATTLLLLVLALAFYNTGTIWAHEVDIFRSWRLVDRGSFQRVQAVHWKKLPYWIFAPVGLALAGSVALVWFHPARSPAWGIWGGLGLQLASLVLTAALWGPWQAALSRDERGPDSPHLARILATHWIRTLLINASAIVILLWALQGIAHAGPSTVALSGHVRGASGKHAVYVALWRREGFLEHPAQQARFAPGTPTEFRFQVPAGEWAVSAFDDQNDNGVLDMGTFGPKEPTGFWRPFTGWRRPKFDDVAAPVARDTPDADITLK
jgi:uncharacterized protein (DUF2141 family)